MLFSTEPEKYAHMNTMDVFSPPGTQVVYTGINGYAGDKAHANKFLTIGNLYTIEETIVYSSNTDVILEEYPSIKFNSVMFIPAFV